VSTTPRNNDALVNTCRQIRKLLGSAKPSPALRVVSPQVAEALPLVQALILGIEDLADRTTQLEAGVRDAHRAAGVAAGFR
jgi:hypothetical protein